MERSVSPKPKPQPNNTTDSGHNMTRGVVVAAGWGGGGGGVGWGKGQTQRSSRFTACLHEPKKTKKNKKKNSCRGVCVKTLSAPALTEQKRAQSSLFANITASQRSFWPQEMACEDGGGGGDPCVFEHGVTAH